MTPLQALINNARRVREGAIARMRILSRDFDRAAFLHEEAEYRSLRAETEPAHRVDEAAREKASEKTLALYESWARTFTGAEAAASTVRELRKERKG